MRVCADLHAGVSETREGKPKVDRAGQSQWLPPPGPDWAPAPPQLPGAPSPAANSAMGPTAMLQEGHSGPREGIYNEALGWTGESGKGPLRQWRYAKAKSQRSYLGGGPGCGG